MKYLEERESWQQQQVSPFFVPSLLFRLWQAGFLSTWVPQGQHPLLSCCRGWERVFVIQENYGLFTMKLLYLASLEWRKGQLHYDKIEKTEQKNYFTALLLEVLKRMDKDSLVFHEDLLPSWKRGWERCCLFTRIAFWGYLVGQKMQSHKLFNYEFKYVGGSGLSKCNF